MTPAYKVDDYIIVKAKAMPTLLNKTVRIAAVIGDCYLIDLLDDGDFRPWKCDIADVSTVIDKARTILYAKR